MSQLPSRVEAEGDSLIFPDKKQQARFEVGTSSAIFLWDELTTAVDNNWGGADSAEKREWLVGVVLDLFEDRVVEAEDIEYRLLGVMEDEFDVVLETDGAFRVAQTILGLYVDCLAENYANVDAVYQKFLASQNREKVKVQVADSDEDDDEEEDGEDEEENGMEIDEAPSKQEPIVDEDGFELVQPRRRR